MGDLTLRGATSGSITITPTAVAGTNTITLPAATGTLALTASPTFTGVTTESTITSPAATALTIQSAGTTAITVDTSQNVGIGTTSPVGALTVVRSSSSTTIGGSTAVAQIGNSNGGAINLTAGIELFGSGPPSSGNGNRSGGIYGIYESYNAGGNAGALAFATNSAGGTSVTERMRIDSSGNFLVGTTTVVNTGKVISGFNGSSSVGFVANDTASASAGVYYGCSLNGTFIGSIQRVGATSAVVYNTTSDQRLKSNIADANSVLSTLINVKVRQYDWTDGDLHQDYGFIAQELESVLSGVVTKGKTEEDMWQLDYSRLTPHLVKAIQELSAKNDALEARLAALEAK